MIFAVVEATDDAGVLQILLFGKRENAETIFKELIEEYCTSDPDPDEGDEYTPEDIEDEINQAIENGWSWTGWDSQVEIHEIDGLSDDLVNKTKQRKNIKKEAKAKIKNQTKGKK